MSIQTPTNLKNHFLIATPAMSDPNFAHSITYLCEHDANGAMGLVINRPLEVPVSRLFEELELTGFDSDFEDMPVMSGGPVQIDRGFVLHRGGRLEWDSSLAVSDDVWITSSRDILAAISHAMGPTDYLISLGYAGWGPGQLDEELTSSGWVTVPANPDIIFNVPAAERWETAMKSLGIDPYLLSDTVGHA